MLNETKAYVNHCARDLLRVVGDLENPNSDWLKITVDFAHRTVFEFITTATMQKLIDERVPSHFLQLEICSHLALAQTKFFSSPRTESRPRRGESSPSKYRRSGLLDLNWLAAFINSVFIVGQRPISEAICTEIDKVVIPAGISREFAKTEAVKTACLSQLIVPRGLETDLERITMHPDLRLYHSSQMDVYLHCRQMPTHPSRTKSFPHSCLNTIFTKVCLPSTELRLRAVRTPTSKITSSCPKDQPILNLSACLAYFLAIDRAELRRESLRMSTGSRYPSNFSLP